MEGWAEVLSLVRHGGPHTEACLEANGGVPALAWKHFREVWRTRAEALPGVLQDVLEFMCEALCSDCELTYAGGFVQPVTVRRGRCWPPRSACSGVGVALGNAPCAVHAPRVAAAVQAGAFLCGLVTMLPRTALTPLGPLLTLVIAAYWCRMYRAAPSVALAVAEDLALLAGDLATLRVAVERHGTVRRGGRSCDDTAVVNGSASPCWPLTITLSSCTVPVGLPPCLPTGGSHERHGCGGAARDGRSL